jgi:hypothetical protein
MGEKQPYVYSSIIHVTDGVYHAIKIIRRLSMVELYVDGSRVELDGEHSMFMVNIKYFKKIYLFRIFTSVGTTIVSCTTTFTYWKF